MKAKLFTSLSAAALLFSQCHNQQETFADESKKPKLALASVLPLGSFDADKAVINKKDDKAELIAAEIMYRTHAMSDNDEEKPTKPKKKVAKKKATKRTYKGKTITTTKSSYSKTQKNTREPKEGDVIFSYFVPYSTTATVTKASTPSVSSSSTNNSESSTYNRNTTTSPKQPDNTFEREGRDAVFKVSEVKPSYPGGDREMIRFLSNSVRYPTQAREDKVEGTVFVQFVVEKDGTVDDVAVAKSVHPLLDAEAKRVVEKMPKWAAGRQNGNNVAVQYTLPVRFQLVD